MCRQVKFRITDSSVGDITEILGGIGIYNDDILVNVICGCCGGMLEPDDVEILEVYDHWINIFEEMIGD